MPIPSNPSTGQPFKDILELQAAAESGAIGLKELAEGLKEFGGALKAATPGAGAAAGPHAAAGPEAAGEMGRAARQMEAAVSRLQSQAAYARTPEGRGRMQEAAGYRGQLQEARRAAVEPMGPPRAVFREQERVEARRSRADEREDRQALAARRLGVGIAEREEAKLSRAAEREDREAAQARRYGARIREQEEAKQSRATQQEEVKAAKAKTEAERERSQAVWGRLGPVAGGAMGMGALASSGLLGRSSGLASGAASLLGGAALGGVPGALVALSGVAKSFQQMREASIESASMANPQLGATVEASRQLAEVARGSNPQVQREATTEAVGQQAYARFEKGQMTAHEAMMATAEFQKGGKKPDWYKEEVGLESLGLPSGPIRSGEEIMQSATRASMTGGEVSSQVREDQLKAIQAQTGLLQEIRDTNLDGVAMKWRR